MTIHFHEPAINKPIVLNKFLKLFDESPQNTKRPVVHEDYDEIVFVEPGLDVTNILRAPAELIEGQGEDDIKIDERMKIDRASLEKGYKDTEFVKAEESSEQFLKKAIEFFEGEINKKKKHLGDMED